MTDKTEPAKICREMADRLDRNDPAEFAGCYVIISPKGKVVSHALFNPTGDEASFWGFVSAQVQTSATLAVQDEEDKFQRLGIRR